MKMRVKAGLALVLLVVSSFLLFSDQIGPVWGPIYGLKRLQEKIYLSFKTTPQAKAQYQEAILDTRANELKSLVESQNYDFLLSSSLRYSATAGELVSTIQANNLKDQVDNIKNEFVDHQKLFQNLLATYPKGDYNKEWKYLQDDINYLDIYLNQLNKTQ